MITGKRSKYDVLKIFGCLVYATAVNNHDKFTYCAIEHVFIVMLRIKGLISCFTYDLINSLFLEK